VKHHLKTAKSSLRGNPEAKQSKAKEGEKKWRQAVKRDQGGKVCRQTCVSCVHLFVWGARAYPPCSDAARRRRIIAISISNKWYQSQLMPKYLQFKEMSIIPAHAVKEGGVSLSYPMLTATNYSTWAIKMEANMDAQGLWEAIEPADRDAMDSKKDKLARACLFGAVPDDVLQQIAKKKTAKEVWESLKTRCLGVDRVKKARVQTLKSDFKDLHMKDTESIDEFAGKISGLSNKLSDLGASMEDGELVKNCLTRCLTSFCR
jgi:hypothetical protein